MRDLVARGVLVVLVLMSGVLPASAETMLELRSWKPALDARVEVPTGGTGLVLDLKDHLGVADKRFSGLRLDWRSGPRSFMTLGYERVRYDGDRALAMGVVWGDAAFGQGTRVVSRSEFRHALWRWGWQVLGGRDRRAALGPMLEVAGISFESALEAPDLAPAPAASRRFDRLAPAVGAALDMVVSQRMSLVARAAITPSGGQGTYEHGEAALVLRFAGPFTVSGGYRVLRVEVEEGTDQVVLDQTGPFLGLTVRF